MSQYMKKLVLAGAILGILTSCGKNPNDTGTEFAPNMYHSVAYEPLTQTEGELNTINPNGLNMREPVKGTVPQKKYADSQELNEAFLKQDLISRTIKSGEMTTSENVLSNPLEATPENIEAGRIQYERFCQHCHGEGGKGDGAVGKIYKGVPIYSSDALKDLNDGHIFHVITHGKGRMWPHGSQITPENRWKIVLYVHELQKQ